MINKRTFIYIICVLIISTFISCELKQDKIDHTDTNYIYVYQYHGDDSTLVKFHQPVYREYPIVGGHHKNHHIKVDYIGDGIYRCVKVPYGTNRCEIVNKAQQATYSRPLIGIFKVSEYPISSIEFVRYK